MAPEEAWEGGARLGAGRWCLRRLGKVAPEEALVDGARGNSVVAGGARSTGRWRQRRLRKLAPDEARVTSE